MNQSTQIFSVEHVQVRSTRPFAEVVRRIEAETGIFDGGMVRAALEHKVSPSSALDAIASMAGRSGFMRFAALDHGAVLRLQGKPAEAVRFLIGHPLTASRIAQLRIRTSLYAPLSLLVAADGSAGTLLEYDRPSTLLGRFAEPGIEEVARELDEKLAALVASAAG